ncbi:MAG: hypothetical protein HKN00_08960 [Flavobacteriaceae bacterium]|nr:adenylate/guanylate cyclase domain-containing protein [Bacteroidia bacterium]NNF75299.1 hypothetical protein [Flavobacteriaceae bacterium]
MVNNSVPGKINISKYTYKLIKEDFNREYRGQIKVKNHGEMAIYFIN